MKPIYFLLVLGTMSLFSCKLKRGITHNGILQEALVSPGVYAMRLCYKSKPRGGLEVDTYNRCHPDSIDAIWNHLTYFEFVSDSQVDYNSMKPGKKKTEIPDEKVPVPYFSGPFEVSTDPSTGERTIHMDLSEKWKRRKNKNFNRKVELDFVILSQDLIQLKHIKFFDSQFIRVYDLDSLFGNETEFLYSLECFPRFEGECNELRDSLQRRLFR